MLEDGNPDFSKLTAAQTAELYDTQFDEDADGIVSGYVSDAKKALDKANNMTVNGKTFVEQKASKDASDFGAPAVLGSLYRFLLRIPHFQRSDTVFLVCRFTQGCVFNIGGNCWSMPASSGSGVCRTDRFYLDSSF